MKTWNRSSKTGHRNYNKATKREDSLISTNQKLAEPKNITQQPYCFTRRFGSTVFRVSVHMNPNAKETAEAKIARLVRMEVDSRKAGEA